MITSRTCRISAALYPVAAVSPYGVGEGAPGMEARYNGAPAPYGEAEAAVHLQKRILEL